MVRILFGLIVGFVVGVYAYNTYVSNIGATKCIDAAQAIWDEAHEAHQ